MYSYTVTLQTKYTTKYLLFLIYTHKPIKEKDITASQCSYAVLYCNITLFGLGTDHSVILPLVPDQQPVKTKLAGFPVRYIILYKLYVRCEYSKLIRQFVVTWPSVMVHTDSKNHIDRAIILYYCDIILYYCLTEMSLRCYCGIWHHNMMSQ